MTMNKRIEVEGEALLQKLRGTDFSKADVRVYLARRYIARNSIAATIRSVCPGDKLVRRIRSTVQNVLSRSSTVKAYEPEMTDADGAFLLESPKEANWEAISEKMLNGEIESAESLADLKDSDLLIADITCGDLRLFAATKLPEKITNGRMMYNTLIWKEKGVELLDESEKIVNITFRVDFFASNDLVFIAEKSNYEKVMNIREGMLNKKAALLTKAGELKKFKGLDTLERYIGDNMTLLRRAAKAHNAGHLDDEEFFNKLHALIAQYPKFGISVDSENHILITEKNAEAVLYLLNDARAETLVNKRLIDVKSGEDVNLN